MSEHFRLLAYLGGAIVAFLGAVGIITGAIVRKNSNEIKDSCSKKFEEIKGAVSKFEVGAQSRSERTLVLETKYAEILSRLTRLETIMDKNAVQTEWIYAYMSEQKKIEKKRR